MTLKQAFPNTSRFILCAILLYAGFTFCGWLVLGPYHMKVSIASCIYEFFFLKNKKFVKLLIEQRIYCSKKSQNMHLYIHTLYIHINN